MTAWFSRLVRHPARKRSGSILTTPEPARGSLLQIPGTAQTQLMKPRLQQLLTDSRHAPSCQSKSNAAPHFADSVRFPADWVETIGKSKSMSATSVLCDLAQVGKFCFGVERTISVVSTSQLQFSVLTWFFCTQEFCHPTIQFSVCSRLYFSRQFLLPRKCTAVHSNSHFSR